MFEKLFFYPAVLQRHRAGPLAAECEAFIEMLDAKGMAHGTLLRVARYCRCLSDGIASWPADHCFNVSEVETLVTQWSAGQVASGRASGPMWPIANTRFIAREFLRFIGRLCAPDSQPPGKYEAFIADYITAEQDRLRSPATLRSKKWQINRFLAYIEQREIRLESITATDVDAFFKHMSQRWSRCSLAISAHALRTWLTHCEKRGWVQLGIAASIMVPRIYRQEGIPIGPSWADVGKMLDRTLGNDVQQLRDHAVLLLLSVYGLRSGEVRSLRLDDINWQEGRIRVVRSKSGKQEKLPLEPTVGNAIARYLREGRPASPSRIIFLRLRAPIRPLSPSGLHYIVKRQYRGLLTPAKGRGPHGLRHACARHLIEAGLTFKETGDHLGHRSVESTRVYAKIDLTSLRRVALGSLGGLV